MCIYIYTNVTPKLYITKSHAHSLTIRSEQSFELSKHIKAFMGSLGVEWSLPMAQRWASCDPWGLPDLSGVLVVIGAPW